eukprot:SAG31_NODE_21242_length_554_cov_1.037363_1_plen_51_part_01
MGWADELCKLQAELQAAKCALQVQVATTCSERIAVEKEKAEALRTTYNLSL